jgi:hypothetical protein
MQVRREPERRFASLADADFHGETGIPKDAEIFYRGEDGRSASGLSGVRLRSGSEKRLAGRRQPASGIGSSAGRSPDFRTAAVNRVWAGLLRYGFVEPVDDVGPHNRPSHPELLKGLERPVGGPRFQSGQRDALDRAEQGVRRLGSTDAGKLDGYAGEPAGRRCSPVSTPIRRSPSTCTRI